MRSYFNDGRDWMFSHRFGLFIHWGIYSIPAWQEQVQYLKQIPGKEYRQYADQFNPVKYNPDEWLDIAEQAGMSYVVFTTKHLDGFCMWDTKYSDYNIVNTPYGKDTLEMLANACKRRGFKLCLYYSVVDNNQKNYPRNKRRYEMEFDEPGMEPNLEKYMEYVKNQVRELCTNYGEISGFWWDANVLEHRDESVNQLIHELQPSAVINDRGFSEGDLETPERDWMSFVNEQLAFDKPVEQCQSIGSLSWGYKKDEDYYSDSYLLRSLDKIFAKGGNYLLNVGPMETGEFPPQAVRILKRIGEWFHKVKESFENVDSVSHRLENREILATAKGNALYVHLLHPPSTEAVHLHPIDLEPVKATLLNDGSPVDYEVSRIIYLPDIKPKLRLRNLPVNKYAGDVLVVKVVFDKPIAQLLAD